MKTNMLMLALLAAIAAPVAAQDIQDLAPVAAPADLQDPTVKDLAEETGLSQQRVRMVVGPRSGYGEYRITYARAHRQFRDALDEERYNDLMAGRRIELRNRKSATVASVDARPASNPASTP